MSYPQWKDKPSELVSMLRNAAMDAVLGQSGLVGDTLYAKAADRVHALESALEELRKKFEWRMTPSPRGMHYVEHVTMAEANKIIAEALKSEPVN